MTQGLGGTWTAPEGEGEPPRTSNSDGPPAASAACPPSAVKRAGSAGRLPMLYGVTLPTSGVGVRTGEGQ